MILYSVIILLALGAAIPSAMSAGGGIYTRWGSSTCPTVQGNHNTQTLYSGRVGGSWYSAGGGGANHLCMPPDPEYTLAYRSRYQGYARIYGGEYENPVQGTDDNKVPCAVCMATQRKTVLMIPAKTSCPPSWTTEYTGYLMANHHSYRRSMFVCVDKSMEASPAKAGTNGPLFYNAEVRCGYGIDCPPYVEEKELNCVVCTI